MADEEVVEAALSRMDKIKESAGDFRDAVASSLRDMQVEMKDWRFAVESHQEGTIIDVAVKLLIKAKPKK